MALPTGPAVTFIFTDIEGSKRLERAAGSGAWAAVVARHDELLRQAIEAHGGAIVKTSVRGSPAPRTSSPGRKA